MLPLDAPHIMHSHYSRVAESSLCSRFIIESLDVLGCRKTSCSNHLQRNDSTDRNLLRLVDNPHPANAQFFQNLVVAKPLPDQTPGRVKLSVRVFVIFIQIGKIGRPECSLQLQIISKILPQLLLMLGILSNQGLGSLGRAAPVPTGN